MASPGFAVISVSGESLVCEYSCAIKTKLRGKIEARRGNYKAESDRLCAIGYAFETRILKNFVFDAVAMEAMPFGSHRLETLSMVTGCLLHVLATYGYFDVAYYYPSAVKKALCGVGTAEKPQVQTAVQELLAAPWEFKSYDESDAAAVAIHHARANQMCDLQARFFNYPILTKRKTTK